jgi:hypothetical protein
MKHKEYLVLKGLAIMLWHDYVHAYVYGHVLNHVKIFVKKVAEKRAEVAKEMGKSKTIGPAVFDKMFASYREVSSDEGFDEIINIDNSESLKKALENE